MRSFRILFGICITMMVACLIMWIIKQRHIWVIKPPLMSSITLCDSGVITTKITNMDTRDILYSYSLYVDSNKNNKVDPEDILISSSPIHRLSPYKEQVNEPIKIKMEYMKYTFMIEVNIEGRKFYHATIACDSTPTK